MTMGVRLSQQERTGLGAAQSSVRTSEAPGNARGSPADPACRKSRMRSLRLIADDICTRDRFDGHRFGQNTVSLLLRRRRRDVRQPRRWGVNGTGDAPWAATGGRAK